MYVIRTIATTAITTPTAKYRHFPACSLVILDFVNTEEKTTPEIYYNINDSQLRHCTVWKSTCKTFVVSVNVQTSAIVRTYPYIFAKWLNFPNISRYLSSKMSKDRERIIFGMNKLFMAEDQSQCDAKN